MRSIIEIGRSLSERFELMKNGSQWMCVQDAGVPFCGPARVFHP